MHNFMYYRKINSKPAKIRRISVEKNELLHPSSSTSTNTCIIIIIIYNVLTKVTLSCQRHCRGTVIRPDSKPFLYWCNHPDIRLYTILLGATSTQSTCVTDGSTDRIIVAFTAVCNSVTCQNLCSRPTIPEMVRRLKNILRLFDGGGILTS